MMVKLKELNAAAATRSFVPYKLHIYDLSLQMVFAFERFYLFDIELDEEVRALGKIFESKLCC